LVTNILQISSFLVSQKNKTKEKHTGSEPYEGEKKDGRILTFW